MNALVARFKDPAGARYHGGAVLYAVLGYCLGFAGLFADSWLINIPSALLLGHAMVIAAYLIHECGHNAVFSTNPENARLGKAMSWICGASYGTYEDMRHKHFRHHVDNADVIGFDHQGLLARHPALLRVIEALEWCYIPADDLVMHGAMVFTSFVIPERRDQRLRNLGVIAIRGGIFLTVLILWPKVALLYAVAYMLMLTVLRFMDSVQHDYAGQLNLFTDEPCPHKGDREWEEVHTFSNPISLRHEKLNWLVLNFGFHNAHHTRPTLPWYRLPALHRELYGNGPEHVIPFWAQCKMHHDGRVDRIYRWERFDPTTAPSGPNFLRAAQRAEIQGGNAASFLTSF